MNMYTFRGCGVLAAAFLLLVSGCGDRGDSQQSAAKSSAEQPAADSSMPAPLSVLGDSSAQESDPDAGDPGLGVRLGPRLGGTGDDGASSEQKSSGARLRMPGLGTSGDK